MSFTPSRHFRKGDPVVFEMTKHTPHPGPRAEGVEPDAHGEFYRYRVSKFWVVAEVMPDGQIMVRTRRGKTHLISPDNPHLRRPSWWERLRHRTRFPDVASLPPIGKVVPPEAM